MRCPYCQIDSCRRSRRRGLHEGMLSLAGVYPWRCRECRKRFYAFPYTKELLLYAHCPHCGNLELERISSENLRGWQGAAGRWLHVPVLRCDFCRHKFISIRPRRPTKPSPPPKEPNPAPAA